MTARITIFKVAVAAGKGVIYMAVKKMSEQYRLTPTMIKNIVTQKKPGNYRLGKLVNGQSRIKYVGRSDTDVAFRLLTHIIAGLNSAMLIPQKKLLKENAMNIMLMAALKAS